MPGSASRFRMALASALVVVTGALSTAHAQQPITYADPGTYVVDVAKLLDDATRKRLEGWLRELEQKTTAQVKVLAVPATGGEDIESFAQRHFDTWKLGQKDKDNGALLVLALEERQFRIRTGYGVEGTLPDSWCGTVFRTLGRPRFREGEFAQGLEEITIAVANKVADEAGVKLTGIPDMRVANPAPENGGATLVLMVLFVVLVLLAMRYASRKSRRGRGGGWPGTWIGPGSFGGGFGGSGGGFSGGGFGGSSGGGFGGSFGGGGRSGGGGGGGGW